MAHGPVKINTLPLRIDPRRIGYLKFILEGYDGMALVTTTDAKDGLVIIRHPASFESDLANIIDNLSPLIFQAHAE